MENLNDRPAQASYQETLMYLINLINDINHLNAKDFISDLAVISSLSNQLIWVNSGKHSFVMGWAQVFSQ